MATRARSIVIAGVAASLVGICGTARAQSESETLKQQMEALQRQMDELRAKMEQVLKKQAETATAPPAAQAPAAPAPAVTAGTHEFLERKQGDGVTFFTRGGELTLYGNLDLSIDSTTKGIGGMTVDGVPPVGRTGWMGAISSNISYIGVRGFQSLGDSFPARFVYQLETQIDVSASSGFFRISPSASGEPSGL